MVFSVVGAVFGVRSFSRAALRIRYMVTLLIFGITEPEGKR